MVTFTVELYDKGMCRLVYFIDGKVITKYDNINKNEELKMIVEVIKNNLNMNKEKDK